MFARSLDSSPDILAPPNDVDYLISSPIKPSFNGRQSSFMSPANLRILQTPGAGRRKRSRISLSPTKTAHSIRFDDVLLPASPTAKSNNGRRGSLSPDRAQAEGNVSPWRIRVTLEATQDEQPDQGSPSRKRSKPSTTTMKIPLKDESEQTPRRPRGRPRKSATLDATPRAGSPGNTPGPGGTSEQKRRRGRPRKHQAQSHAVEDAEQRVDNPVVVDPVPPGMELDRRSWSPLNLAGDVDSDDGFPEDQAFAGPFQDDDQMELPETNLVSEEQNQRPLEPTYDTPNGDAIDRFHSRQGDDALNSTPSKMPSPVRDTQASPENTLHAGHTPRPPRLYPTPTSSSQVDDEKQEPNHINATATEKLASASKSSVIQAVDPTDEHREYDSIMESEGFSMVSLDTLPSARQHGLRSDSKLVKGALKPFFERESNGVLKRKAHVLDHDADDNSAAPERRASFEMETQQQARNNFTNDATNRRSPQSRPTFRSKSPSIPPRKRFLRLAKLVRAGIALEGVLRRSVIPSSQGTADRTSDLTTSRKRLEMLFSDLDPDSQRLLRVGLGLGQELAMRRGQAEIESLPHIASVEEGPNSPAHSDSPDFEQTITNVSRTPRRQYDGGADSESPSSEMKRRYDEWQREREAVSRTIRMANSSQVIVIDSDVTGPPSPDIQAEEQEEQMSRYGEELEAGVDVDDEDGYEDIWQEQAKDEGNHSYHRSMQNDARPALESSPEKRHPNSWRGDSSPGNGESSPYKGGSTPGHREYGMSFSPAYWVDGQSNIPYLGQSRIKDLQEQELDFSGLLRAADTPNRARYYYGKSSPLSTAHGRSPQRIPSSAVSKGRHSERYADEPEVETDIPEVELEGEPEDYLGLSPHDSENDEFQVDPTTRHESEMQRHRSKSAEDDASISDAAGEPPFVQESRSSPVRSEHGGAENKAANWYQKITSLTPRWLRAPKPESAEQVSFSSEPSDGKPEMYAASEEDAGHVDERGQEAGRLRQYSMERHRLPSEETEEAEENEMYPVDERGPEAGILGQNPMERHRLLSQESEDAEENTVYSVDERGPETRILSHNSLERHRLPSQESEEDERHPVEVQDTAGQDDTKPPSVTSSESDIDTQPRRVRASETAEKAPEERAGLATSGYFSDAHYALLRRLYRLAKQFPESFPYQPNKAHSNIGDWIWTSDDMYGVPITELQFAIVQSFRRELAAEDVRSGGAGEVGWTDADLHRRLVSIIIGEQIREERKEGESSRARLRRFRVLRRIQRR